MGLDMYLTGKRYISSRDKTISPAISKLFPEMNGKSMPIKEISIEAGYWRKANAIHNWFVENVQGGEDACRSHHVSRSQLKALHDVCVEVLNDNDLAEELLPSAQGFFFGSTDYTVHYFNDVKATIDIVKECLLMPEEWSFQYQSSW